MAVPFQRLLDIAAEAEGMHAKFVDLQRRLEVHLLGANCGDARAHLMAAYGCCDAAALLARHIGSSAICADTEQEKARAARAAEKRECQGHEVRSRGPIGSVEYCDGSCRHKPLTPDQIAQVAR
jgi:hypothetical protein